MKKSIFFVFLTMILSLSSCQRDKDVSSSTVVPNVPYYRAEQLGITMKEVKASTNSFKDGIVTDLNSLGSQKILVIPVDFTDYSSDDLTGGANAARERLQATFFGETEETGWESVKSYYQKSSYGQLNIDGFVTDWYHTEKTLSSASLAIAGFEPTWRILRNAVSWYKQNAAQNQWPSIEEFDQDGDGYIDAVWLVYSAPYSNTASSNFQWAFTY